MRIEDIDPPRARPSAYVKPRRCVISTTGCGAESTPTQRWRRRILSSAAAMGVTEVVRGADLIAPTVRQLALYRQLGYKEPDYIHLPLSPAGLKLSKQNHVPALPMSDPRPLLGQALRLLNQPPPCRAMRLESMFNWAVDHWRLDAVPTAPAHSQA